MRHGGSARWISTGLRGDGREGEKKRGSAPCWRRIRNSCEKAIGRRCCAGYSGGIARFSPPGRAPRRRDPGKGPSWSRWGARRPREGARGLRRKFKLLDVMLEKTWHSGARRRRGTRARRDDRAGGPGKDAIGSCGSTTTTRLNVEPTSRRGPWIVLGPHRQSGRRAPSEGKSLCYVGRKEDAPFFAAQTTWARRAGATRAGAAARTAAPATRAREESTTGAEVIADIVLRSMGPMGRRLRREEKT